MTANKKLFLNNLYGKNMTKTFKEGKTMKKYKAYMQEGYGAEAFYIENDEGDHLIIECENDKEAEEKFLDYIYESSIYSEHETTAWIEKNLPYFYVVEVNE